MAASMRGINPELKKYLKDHRLTDIYEVICTIININTMNNKSSLLLN